MQDTELGVEAVKDYILLEYIMYISKMP